MRLCFASRRKADRTIGRGSSNGCSGDGTKVVGGRFGDLPLRSVDMNGIIYLVGLVVVVLAVLSFFGLH
jgi:hypothetical protein